MKWIDLPPRGHRFDTPINLLHTTAVLLFVATMLTWLPMAAFIHGFATVQLDATHSFPVHEHGGTFFLNPILGKVYVNMPWIWRSTLAGSVVITVLRSKSEKRGE